MEPGLPIRALLRPHLKVHGTPFGELDSIAEQVHKDLCEASRIANENVRRLRLNSPADAHALGSSGNYEGLAGIPNDPPEFESDMLQF